MLVVAIFALRHPSERATVAGTSTVTPATTTPVTPGAPSTPHSATPPTGAPSTGLSVTPSATSPAPSGPGAAARLPLVVLNNTTIPGLADRTAAQFTAAGWTVTSVGNYQNDIISTCAYYDPSVTGAQAAAQELQRQFPRIARVLPKFTGLPAGPIVVVLTPDYA